MPSCKLHVFEKSDLAPRRYSISLFLPSSTVVMVAMDLWSRGRPGPAWCNRILPLCFEQLPQAALYALIHPIAGVPPAGWLCQHHQPQILQSHRLQQPYLCFHVLRSPHIDSRANHRTLECFPRAWEESLWTIHSHQFSLSPSTTTILEYWLPILI